MIEILEKYCKKKATKRFLPMPAGDVPTTYADISYSQKKLQFQPKTPLNQGLETFMDWYLRYH
jgi:UDP-glucuronate 4-epimerase